MTEILTSGNNPIVKQIRLLRQRKKRDDTGLFLVEGIHHVGEAIEAGWEIDRILYAPEMLSSDFARSLVEDQIQKKVNCSAMTADLFNTLTEKENPQGILAIVHKRVMNINEISTKKFHLGVALISPQDPGNVGAILRTIDATGADGIFLLDGGVDPYHPSSIRASMGTIFWKPFVETSFDVFMKWARKNGFQVVGSSAHARIDYRSIRGNALPRILLLGNEQKGLTPEQIKECDLCVSIPMKGRASSLNLAVAAGVLLYSIIE